MRRKRVQSALPMVLFLTLPLVILVAFLFVGTESEDSKSPHPQPFWNIADVSGLPTELWPEPIAAAIPIAPDLFLVPIAYVGEVGDGMAADPRAYVRIDDRIVEAEYLALSEKCEVALLRAPSAAVLPFLLARTDITGRHINRVFATKPFSKARFRVVNELGQLCEILRLSERLGDPTSLLSRCSVSTGAALDGVALTNAKGELVAVLADNHEGYVKSGVSAPCLWKFLWDTQVVRDLFHDTIIKRP